MLLNWLCVMFAIGAAVAGIMYRPRRDPPTDLIFWLLFFWLRILLPSRVRIRLEFKPQDCWIGAFWKRKQIAMQRRDEIGCIYPRAWITNEPAQVREIFARDLWICIVPMLPLHFEWESMTRWKQMTAKLILTS